MGAQDDLDLYALGIEGGDGWFSENGPGEPESIVARFGTGAYLIWAHSYEVTAPGSSPAGQVTMRFETMAGDGNELPHEARLLELGRTVEGHIEVEADEDYYRFQLQAPQRVRVQLTPPDETVDYDLALLDTSFHAVGESAREAGEVDALTMDLGAGTYYVVVFGHEGHNAQAPYTVVVAPADEQPAGQTAEKPAPGSDGAPGPGSSATLPTAPAAPAQPPPMVATLVNAGVGAAIVLLLGWWLLLLY